MVEIDRKAGGEDGQNSGRRGTEQREERHRTVGGGDGKNSRKRIETGSGGEVLEDRQNTVRGKGYTAGG